MGEGSWIKYSTDYWGKGRLLDVSSEEAEIERLIASHYIRPSFDGGVYKVQKGQTLASTGSLVPGTIIFCCASPTNNL